MRTRQRLAVIFSAALILSGSFPMFAVKAGQIPEETITEHVPIPDEAPPFHARIEFRMGYTVIGTFTDFTSDIDRIQTQYSLDGENWQTGTRDWNLYNLGTDDEYKLPGLQNQPCLFNADEPLRSYIAGEIDRFYLRLLITQKNGVSYESQSAVIERGGLQPIPKGTERRACFASAIAAREPDPAAPYRYRRYGRYQLTVSADATAEDVSALLPDTLPVEIQLDRGADFMAIGVIDCPVTWKPLSLPQLTPGESITISDAAEEILIPSGTLVPTPIGTFQLEEPLSLDAPPSTDEVRLVLNVSQEDLNPAGVLREGKNGLEMAFQHKPTGAVSIQAFVLTEGESNWTELSGLSLTQDLNQPSTANSGYALVLGNDQEPYRSYLAAIGAGETPTPFFVGLKIEGGIYDGKQLILPWPDTYEQLPDLPKVGGAEGNEGNAGADNKDDSTESGQRPNLPQPPDDNQEEQTTPAPVPEDNHEDQQPDTETGDSSENGQHPDLPQVPNDNQEEQQPNSETEDGSENGQHPNLPQIPEDFHEEQQPDTETEDNIDSGQRPGLPQIPEDIPEERQPKTETEDNTDGRQKQQTNPIQPPETASAIPKNQNSSAPDASASAYPSNYQEQKLISEQRQILAQATTDTAGTAAGNQEDNLQSAPLVVQPETNVTSVENISALSHIKTAIEHNVKNSSSIPFLSAATAIAAVICIGAAACTSTGYSLFHRITGKIRNILHK